MGSRGRSIRLRIYFLVAIPLVMMLGLAGIFAYSSVTSYRNVSRAPNLILATAEQSARFVLFLQHERRAALVYLASPNAQNLKAYQAMIATTKSNAAQFDATMTSPAVTSVETAQEAAALRTMMNDINGMDELRLGIEAHKLSLLQAFGGYTLVIANQPKVFQSEATSFIDARGTTQALGVIEIVQAREDVDEDNALLASAFASGSLTPQVRATFNQAAGRLQDEQLLYPSLLSPTELKSYNTAMGSPSAQTADTEITKVRNAVLAGESLRDIEAQGMTPSAWQNLNQAWSNNNYQGGLNAADDLLRYDQGVANNARNRLIIVGAVGLAGLLFTLIVTMVLAGSINRRLSRLRRGAITLATEHLPAVVARLRRGENVDVAAEAPTPRFGKDEIGQVGQAIDMVRQTALRSAVEESRLRTGINDMFRNLARRNQSLLQRQLTMLDGMERRATDPDVLDDLFKMDHLTTRMRRHAEGLIILSGAAPGRGWSNPVKLIDVMRGAVAEVEDFARVIVTTQSRAALTGTAVTDLIHLLAELIENATTLSPPFTQVRVHGEMVANGFAIEIEDRGLGMTPTRMDELNERLANPPEVNPSNTEQLGLFVVGQLARRHGIGVVLRPSAYGGTTAVVMIPQRLVVDDSTPAISGPQPTAASGAARSGPPYSGLPQSTFASGPQSAVVSGPQPTVPSGPQPTVGSGPQPTMAGAAPAATAAAFGAPMPFGAPVTSDAPAPAPVPGAVPMAGGGPGAGGFGSPPDLDSIPLSSPPFGTPSPFASPAFGTPSPYGSPAPGDPVISGVAVTRPTLRPVPGNLPPRAPEPAAPQAPSYSSSSFYGTPAAEPAAPPAPDSYGQGSSYDPGSSYGTGSYPTGSYGPGTYDSGNGYRETGGANGGYETVNSPEDGNGENFKGLPRRVRQANLAPELRASRDTGGTRVPQASAPDPADVKNTLSAMQRGWQQGRAQSRRDSEGTNGI